MVATRKVSQFARTGKLGLASEVQHLSRNRNSQVISETYGPVTEARMITPSISEDNPFQVLIAESNNDPVSYLFDFQATQEYLRRDWHRVVN